jgi:hypothetical protein
MGWVEITRTVTYGQAMKAYGEIEVMRTWLNHHRWPNWKEYDANDPYPYKVMEVLGDDYRDHGAQAREEIDAVKLDELGHRL